MIEDQSTTEPSLPTVSRAELGLVAFVILLFALVSLSAISDNTALGHDESVYALRAEAFDTNQSPSDWHDYRAPGLPWLLQFAFLDSQPESEMRFVVVLFGVMLVQLTWIIGRQLFDRRIAVLAALGVALTPTVLRASTQIWPDIPGAAVTLAIVAVFLAATSGDRVHWWVVFIVPLTYWATVMRFGAPIPIAVALVVIGLIRWSTMVGSWKLIALTALGTALAVFSVLLIPVLTGAEGSPLSAFLELRRENAPSRYQGLLDHLRTSDYLFGGPHGLLMAVGVALALIRRRPILSQGGKIALWTGVGAAVSIGLSVPGEPRYLSVVFPFIWIIAAAGTVTVIDKTDHLRVVAAFAVVSLFLAYSAMDDGRVFASSQADALIRSAAEHIDVVEELDECGVITGYTPQVRWYSNCDTGGYVLNRVIESRAEFSPNGDVYLLWLAGGKRQPDESVMTGYIEESQLIFESGTPGGNLRYVAVRLLTDG